MQQPQRGGGGGAGAWRGPAGVVEGWRRGGGGVLSAADRRMLQAVRDNLSHVRQHAAAGTAAAAAGGSSSPRRPDAGDATPQNGASCESGVASRLNYNKKAMDEIRQSLQFYHVVVTTSYTDTTASQHIGATDISSVAQRQPQPAMTVCKVSH